MNENGLRLRGEVRGVTPTKGGKYIVNVEIDSGNLKVLSSTNGQVKGSKFDQDVFLFSRCKQCGATVNDLIGVKEKK